MPLMDPDVKSNGTNRARLIRYQALVDPNTWYKISFKKDPFDDSTDIMTDENIETMQQIMDDICEGTENLFIKASRLFMAAGFPGLLVSLQLCDSLICKRTNLALVTQ